MLDFSHATNGWAIVFAGLISGVSVAIAFLLGRASERRSERWRKFDRLIASVDAVIWPLYEDALARRQVSPIVDEAYERLLHMTAFDLDVRDAELPPVLWAAVDRVRTKVRHLAGTQRILPDAERDRMWGEAQYAVQIPRIELVRYRSRRRNRAAALKRLRAM